MQASQKTIFFEWETFPFIFTWDILSKQKATADKETISDKLSIKLWQTHSSCCSQKR